MITRPIDQFPKRQNRLAVTYAYLHLGLRCRPRRPPRGGRSYSAAMARCELHMVDDCPYCKEAALAASQYPKNVYISSGGLVFHKDKDCAGLREGQKKVSRRGGTPGQVIALELKQAKNKGKEPCQVCFPPPGRPPPGRPTGGDRQGGGRGPKSPAESPLRLEFPD